MIRLIGFDLDDTLFNATSLATQARIGGLKKIQECGLDFTLQEGIASLSGIVKEFGSNYSKHYNELLKRMLSDPKKYGISLNEFSISKYVAAGVMGYHEVKIRKIRSYPDVKKILKNLQNQGFILIIISDGLAVKQYEKLIRMDILKYFMEIFISEEVGLEKPHHEFFLHCLDKMGVKPSESMYVGDRLDHDIDPAHQIGMHTVLIHRGGKYDPKNIDSSPFEDIHKPDHEIDNLFQLLPILKSIK